MITIIYAVQILQKIMEKNETTNKELYSEIEHLIIIWSNDGTKTAGFLTRQIIELLNEEKNIKL